ncbi:MAG: sensor histidine kinase, partial [Anaerolineales bacterium]
MSDLNAGRRKGQTGQVLAGAVAIVGLLTLIEYLFSLDLGIDQLLFQDDGPIIGATRAGRMALNTALNFVLIGSALLLLDKETRRGLRPAQFLTLAVASMAGLILFEYVYGWELNPAFGPHWRMPVLSAFAFILLSAGLLYSRPDRGLMADLTSAGPGGVLARRVLPVAQTVWIVLGLIRVETQRVGWLSTEFAVALFTVINMLLLAAVVWVTARFVNRTDAHRQQAEEDLRQRSAQLEAANKELEAFCYSVAHDLRAPLRSIDGFSQIVLEDCLDKLEPQARDSLQRVRAATQRMGTLIDDLLELSRVTRSEMHRESVDLSALTREGAQELDRNGPGRRVELVIAPG